MTNDDVADIGAKLLSSQLQLVIILKLLFSLPGQACDLLPSQLHHLALLLGFHDTCRGILARHIAGLSSFCAECISTLYFRHPCLVDPLSDLLGLRNVGSCLGFTKRWAPPIVFFLGLGVENTLTRVLFLDDVLIGIMYE